ncbi:Mut7-C RNAse domain-containing protein [Nitratifractor sp.]|uniref:Mut7-C RNAse domain-containing protein n=1 Tax=Nitratifractor sp. TaxID=2268144 RepID=UPI0025FB829A|nr:Mut7-C RNAse domain-containing protein [Nitratifractor sp.]
MKKIEETEPRFIADAHLGKLARHLRFAGCDTLLFREGSDRELKRIAAAQSRILLTRDRGIPEGGTPIVVHLHSPELREQLIELSRRFPLHDCFRPFSRCMVCNTPLHSVSRDAVRDRIPPAVAEHFNTFKECPGCGRIYWKGDHYRRMLREWESIFSSATDRCDPGSFAGSNPDGSTPP